MSLTPLNTAIRDKHGLLSPVAYDEDASSLHSRSDQDTDSEDDKLMARARNSRELRARDRLVLMEEEEMDKLVAESRAKQETQRRGNGIIIPNPLRILRTGSQIRSNSTHAADVINSSVDDLHRDKRRGRRTRRKEKKDRLLKEARHGEDGALMYEMESGALKEGSSTGESSDREDSEELDRQRLLMHSDQKTEKRKKWRKWVFLHTLIAVGFAFLMLLAWKLSVDKKRATPQLVSNGTALFAPTTLIISLDGFRADFLNRGLTPRLNAFIKEGVSPLYMLPSFPSVTFPNHYTLATGLYPEAHGVVGNTFWDPALKAEFYYTDPSRSMDPKWWGGEPFWVTAERQGIRSAIHMWPGSEAHIDELEPSFLDLYNGKEKLPNKVARILELLDKPGMEDPKADIEDMRPQVIAAYVPNVDADGHKYGPNSTEIRSTISEVDVMLDQIFHGLEVRNLTDIVNVIIVSDHGMATTDVSRMLQLDDFIDMNLVDHLDGWPLVGVRPKDPANVQTLYQQALDKGEDNPNIEIYLKENMPERYHFSKNDRIAPLWIIPKTGWAVVTREEFDIEEANAKGLVYHPRGLHGYDHEHPLMRAIFIARGPAFPHQPNSRVEPFQNIEVYNMLCDSVGMEPKPNNGTLRLPLKPIGLHDSETVLENLDDPVSAYKPSSSSSALPTSTAVESVTGVMSISPVETSSAADASEGPPTSIGVDPVDYKPKEQQPPSDEKEGDADSKAASIKHAWDWLTGKLDDLWSKLTGSKSDESR
ncbi:type I phosphodiesterase/nucleotide pyrophosphatase [Pseudomassariella vexata]|uniref:Type I phosphodiesterase/nucleotide pyrophosphatase n=1 Tax=Pseudomassariella vexata TaxID=1141098 RepID=A0A1Y2DMW8_9PEZI|nr:type I phosphodiesterase/nucleotide pyrophosphatase [Pseudomassariella vexata]ORY60504.1 type I phosphodiesterase/nucleotide pyrophosphatase [Pseudomassariella vexata]